MKKFSAFLLGATLSFSAAITPAHAFTLPPGVAYRISYYTDFSMTVLIGQDQINCDGSFATWGGISEWNAAEYGDC